jgi:23S rRNA pseudouridine1911/1915/1917 synthase
MTEKLIINLKKKSERKLDKLIQDNCPSHLSLSRTKIQELISKSKVFDAEYYTPLSKKDKTDHLERVIIYYENYSKDDIPPQKLDVPIVFENKSIVIFNKPPNMIVHPVKSSQRNTLVNFLIYKYQETLPIIFDKFRPGIVHRLDKDTSGLIAIAKTKFGANSLIQQFKNRQVKKGYLALCIGNPLDNMGKIVSLPGISILEDNIIEVRSLIGRNKYNREMMDANVNDGRLALSRFSVRKVYQLSETKKLSLLSCEIETGRTHQIRVHSKFIGHPIFGDKLYKSRKKDELDVEKALSPLFLDGRNRQMLHANRLSILNPRSGKNLSFECDLPADFSNLLLNLNKYGVGF